MKSISIYLVIMGCIGLLISYLRFNSKDPVSENEFTMVNEIKSFIGVLFIFQVFPILIYEDKKLASVIILIAYLLLLYLVNSEAKGHIKDKRTVQFIMSLLLMNQSVALMTTHFSLYYSIVSVVANFVIAIIVIKKILHKKTDKAVRKIWLSRMSIGYVLMNIGIVGVKYETEEHGVGFTTLLQKTSETPPVLLGFSLIVAIIAFLYCIVFACRKADASDNNSGIKIEAGDEDKEGDEGEECGGIIHSEWGSKKRVKVGLKDILIMAWIMLVFAVVGFINFGSTNIPQTIYRMTQDNREVVLNLGENVEVADVKVFLDYRSNAVLSYSVYDMSELKWDVVIKEEKIKYPFRWNSLSVNRKTQYLGIVLSTEEIRIREIVITDSEGNILTPVNADEYLELFDEQEIYPEYETNVFVSTFDEVYHARTAYEFLNDLPIYEVSHPPLGKSIIAIGIVLFGMNPFGWRFMSLMAGIACIPFMYLFGLKLTKKRMGGIVAGVLIATETMHFTLSRIATLDIFVALFIIATFYFMYNYLQGANEGRKISYRYTYLLLSGVAAALAIATKWTGLYAGAGLCVIFVLSLFEEKRNAKDLVKLALLCIFSFVILPVTFYILSYKPFVDVNGGTLISNTIENIKYIFSYHSGVEASHPCESKWYEWMINKIPVFDSFCRVGDKISSISTFGNPLVVWGGLVALIYTGYLFRCKGDKVAGFLSIMYLGNFLPWLMVARTLFIYHYYVNILVMILMISYSVMSLNRKRNSIRLAWIVMGISLLMFVLLYPEASGLPVSADYIKAIEQLFVTWRFGA